MQGHWEQGAPREREPLRKGGRTKGGEPLRRGGSAKGGGTLRRGGSTKGGGTLKRGGSTKGGGTLRRDMPARITKALKGVVPAENRVHKGGFSCVHGYLSTWPSPLPFGLGNKALSELLSSAF